MNKGDRTILRAVFAVVMLGLGATWTPPLVAQRGVGPGAEEKVLKMSPVVHVGLSHGLYHSLRRAVEKAAKTPKDQPMVLTISRGEAEDLVIQAAQGMANGRRWVAP